MTPLELNDMQGLLARGHGDLPAAEFLMLGIDDAHAARIWLRETVETITHAAHKPNPARLHLAFTWPGLKKLGADEFVEKGFSVEFVQGMATPYRARILGDLGESAADRWEWGGPETPEIHILLMVYARDAASLAAKNDELQQQWEAAGLTLVQRLDSATNPHAKEHFGFRDGVGQPIIPGLKKTGPPENTVPAGEFILGYENAYNQRSDSPLVPKNNDPEGLLAGFDDTFRDFGRNGSYMVFRQLKQDVANFWQQVGASVKHENPDAKASDCIFLAAKMVGRWPDGTPVTLSPDGPKEGLETEDNFGYAEKDSEGFKCPFGSHIRRANPRDAMPDNKPKSSVKISNRHRILRRGRNFGPPLVDSFETEKLLSAKDDGQVRGLQFICFNTNIARQFEFVQHQWSNNTKFAGMYSDPDPILGIKDSRDKSLTHDFTIQASPVRRKVRGLRRHVHVIGGAYFFMPGLRALRFLAHYNPST